MWYSPNCPNASPTLLKQVVKLNVDKSSLKTTFSIPTVILDKYKKPITTVSVNETESVN